MSNSCGSRRVSRRSRRRSSSTGEIVWERGFGFQNLETRLRATPDTPYPISDLSQTLSSALVLECVEQRRVSLDDKASAYGISLPESNATLRQVMNNTSAAPSGEAFKYDTERYAQIGRVVEACLPQPYRKTVAVRILERFAMKNTVPGRDVQDESIISQALFAATVQQRYKEVLERVATPYKVDKKGRASRSDILVEGLSGSGGVISTVRDLARFDAAIDSLTLLHEQTLIEAWTPPIGSTRGSLPMGLGWFVQRYNGEAVVWHFGLTPNGYSSLILKIPSKRLTLILLANSDGLSSAFDLPSGDVTKSLFAVLFLRLFG